ncbi:MAG: protease modulator HflC [Lentisphaerae bacterium]|nr:protease modulator HflC [Lentisphaerota bacterium]
MATGNFFKHWPTMLLGLIVAVILLTAVFSFQLNQTDVAVITTFGRPAVVETPGLHFRWPFPFQKVYRFDKRIRCFEGSSGKLEETATRDGHNILAGIYVDYRIGNPEVFFKQLKDIPNAEEVLNNLMRSEKNSAFGLYNFNQIVNTDPKKLKLDEIQNQIKSNLITQTEKFGIDIVGVGINSLGVPKTITEKVFDRMVAERKQFADRSIAEGKSKAREIRISADRDRTIALAEAEARAQRIRAEGDAKAAESYKTFSQDPALAEFLRKLEALRTILKGRTTVVFDTNVPPFDLLNAANSKPVFKTDLPVVPAAK